jgi:hypothetical protein
VTEMLRELPIDSPVDLPLRLVGMNRQFSLDRGIVLRRCGRGRGSERGREHSEREREGARKMNSAQTRSASFCGIRNEVPRPICPAALSLERRPRILASFGDG